MSELSKKLIDSKKIPKDEQPGQRPKDEPLPKDERNALNKLKNAAIDQDCVLSSDGEGGLLPSLVWHVFRRDADKQGNFICKQCGEKGTDDNGGLGLHHIRQHMRDPKLMKQGAKATVEGRRNDPKELEVICDRCHNEVHEEDREENPGKPDADEALGG